MLIEPRQTQPVSGRNLENIGQTIRRNAEFGLLAGGDHLGAVSGAYAGIEAHHDPAAGIDPAVQLQLGQGIHADQQTVIHGVLQLVRAHVVAYIHYFLRPKSGQKIEPQFTGRHGVDQASLFADNAQQRGVGVGLGRIVHVKARMRRQAQQLAAALPQDVLAVDIKRRAETRRQFPRVLPAEKSHAVSIRRSDVRHTTHSLVKTFAHTRDCFLPQATERGNSLLGRSRAELAASSPGRRLEGPCLKQKVIPRSTLRRYRKRGAPGSLARQSEALYG